MYKKRLFIILQAIFWVMMLIIQLAMGGTLLPFKINLMFTGLNIILALIVYYLNDYWIIPRFFNKKSYGFFLLLNLSVHILLSLVYINVDEKIVSSTLTIDFQAYLPAISPELRIFSLLIFTLVISLVFSLLRKVEIQDITTKRLSEEKMETEIQLLKAQINPHFIFNSLNNIYSLAYTNSEQTPDAVLKLSDMLRYVYYDCNRDEVSLGSELKYIRNYIAFQQMKSSHEQSIVLESENIEEDYRIAPMLFIPFVENSFKYSRIEEIDNAKVDIRISTSRNMLWFHISNTYPEIRSSSGSRMGIENVRNRLEHTYPERHELIVKEESGLFTVELKIDKS